MCTKKLFCCFAHPDALPARTASPHQYHFVLHFALVHDLSFVMQFVCCMPVACVCKLIFAMYIQPFWPISGFALLYIVQ